MCCGYYQDDPDDEPASHCRMCDAHPCMCGKKDYSSNNQFKKREQEDREYFDRLSPFPQGPEDSGG